MVTPADAAARRPSPAPVIAPPTQPPPPAVRLRRAPPRQPSAAPAPAPPHRRRVTPAGTAPQPPTTPPATPAGALPRSSAAAGRRRRLRRRCRPSSGSRAEAFTDADADRSAIEALNGLIEAHGDRVIPLLRDIAFDDNNPDEARRAVLVLAQSRRPDARTPCSKWRGAARSRSGSRPSARWAASTVAIGERGADAGLLDGQHAARQAAGRLARSVSEPTTCRCCASRRSNRIRPCATSPSSRSAGCPARAPSCARSTPRRRPTRGAPSSPRSSPSKDDDELIRIARTEKDPLLRARARQQLRMLATPKAIQFLNDNP